MIILLLSFYSCVPHKKTLYLRKTSTTPEDTVILLKDNYKIQVTDLISIQVSSFQTELTEFFNGKTGEKSEGYRVFQNGYIHIPILDSVYVKDLTILQLTDTLNRKISEHVSKPYINVKIANFSFTTLGEFNNKGINVTSDNQLTIIDAIALAGDLTEFANKDRITLIRKIEGKEIFVTLNINERDIMKSPYFYIQPHDVLIAEPLKVKALRSNLGQLSLYFGLFSIVLVLYNLYRSF